MEPCDGSDEHRRDNCRLLLPRIIAWLTCPGRRPSGLCFGVFRLKQKPALEVGAKE
jgi:hypothetical protein